MQQTPNKASQFASKLAGLVSLAFAGRRYGSNKDIQLKVILALTLVFTCTVANASPNWVNESIRNLSSTDEKTQRKAAFRLSGYFTDNGAESDPEIIDKNLDLFFDALSNPVTATSFTEIFGGRYISISGGEYFLYLNRSTPETKERFIEQILINLKSSNRRLAETSADALINLSKCDYENEIRARKKEGKKNGESEFSFKYVLKRLNKKCGKKP